MTARKPSPRRITITQAHVDAAVLYIKELFAQHGYVSKELFTSFRPRHVPDIRLFARDGYTMERLRQLADVPHTRKRISKLDLLDSDFPPPPRLPRRNDYELAHTLEGLDSTYRKEEFFVTNKDGTVMKVTRERISLR